MAAMVSAAFIGTKYANDMIIAPRPVENKTEIEIERGPNIKPCPVPTPISDSVSLPVLLKCGDNITTDDIAPAGAKVLPYRSNIPEISKFVFAPITADFYKKAQAAGAGVVVGGTNYGQGSSREHAALAPMYLGVKAIIVKSFARIHKANLVNYGILPLVFVNPDDYDTIKEGDVLELKGIHEFLESENETINAINRGGEGRAIALKLDAGKYDRLVLRAGGTVPFIRAGKNA
jgi:aconitate hydratase